MSPKIYIDLSDLIIYAANFDQISGIQRIEIEFIKLILTKYTSFEIINAFEADAAKLKFILAHHLNDERILIEKLNEEFAYCNAGPKHRRLKSPSLYLKRAVRDLSRLFAIRLPKFEPGDIVFIPGGFGFGTQILKYYQRLAAAGARLVFFLQDVVPVTQSQFAAKGSIDFFSPAFFLPGEIITTTRFNIEDFNRAYQIVTKTACRAVLHVVPLAHEFPGMARNAPPVAPSKRLADQLEGRAFVLCVGTVEVRKNHIMLLEAWRALKLELGEALPLLVIAGRRGWKAEAALEILDHAPSNADHVLFIEKPSDAELKWLYPSCLFSILPSLFEGWGLPVGESLWFGKACAASNTSSVPEVGGELCVYFDPAEQEDMKAAIRRLLDPVVRKSFEDKIHTADLRTWADVASDLIGTVLRLDRPDKPAS